MTDQNRETRRLAVCEWLKRHDLNPMDILADEGALVARPLNEGELRVSYKLLDPRVHDETIPLRDIVNEDGEIPTTRHEFVTSEAPPGFKLPGWDAWLYMWARRPVMPYPVQGAEHE